MKTDETPKRLAAVEVLNFLFVTAFLMVWFGGFFVAVFAAGGAGAAYAAVRWLAGLGPE
jgi:hypothetical protein